VDAVDRTADQNLARNARRGPSVISRLYPERYIASFSRHEGRFLFYSLVADLLSRDSVVLDLGAGRGAQIESSEGYMRQLISFAGRCKRYIGVDPDPVVLENPFLEEAHVMAADGSIPLPDSSVDLIVANAVLEHVADPRRLVSEVRRLLRPGGWFCAWTPNRRGYVGLAARIVPNKFHAKIVSVAEPQGGRTERDVFRVVYRMNTKAAIRSVFSNDDFEDFSFYDNGTPSYHFNNLLIAKFWLLVMAILPNAMAKSLFVFVRRRPGGAENP
jgi:SAM-dependent methyltransferase